MLQHLGVPAAFLALLFLVLVLIVVRAGLEWTRSMLSEYVPVNDPKQRVPDG